MPAPTRAIENPDKRARYMFADVVTEYTYVFHTVKNIIVVDASMQKTLYESNYYWPLNNYLGFTDIITIAGNPDDDCLFWEAMGAILGTDEDHPYDPLLTGIDRAYSLFKLDLWDNYLQYHIDEETRAQCRFVIHFKNNGIWIAIGE